MKLVLTCEHAGYEIPQEYKELFKNKNEILKTHRGYDPGALDVFRHLLALSHFNYFHPISRLLVEVNRSVGHPQLFSEFTKELSKTDKKQVLEKFYYAYRNPVEETISEILVTGEKVLHLSVHSFTPKLNQEIRNADIGLLYDPGSRYEKEFCKNLKQQFRVFSPQLNVRYNYPYLGKSDGFTTYLRKKFPENYMGIEIEINQKFQAKNKMSDYIKHSVYNALRESLDHLNHRKEEKEK